MGKVYLIFGIHNHQPTGNFHHVFNDAYEHCYLPLLSTLAQYPSLKFSIHNSGCLYDWLIENKPEYLDILKSMIKRGQVEMIGGGYYEPILPLISDEDKFSQIALMNNFIKKEFGVLPQGLWAAERVWEPYLAKILAESGVKFVFLDDTHFRYGGLKEKEFFGYYTTEEQAMPVHVFPISKTLRYKIPFSQPEEAIGILNGFKRDDRDVLITFFDDGEKFGLWPHTFDWVYNKGWLKKFLSLLERSDIIETVTPSDAIKVFASKGIIYLPTASYEEMGEWVLEPDAYSSYEGLKAFLKSNNKFDEYNDFIRGGFFRNFCRKYSRLNYMHKRMLSVSRKINAKANPIKDKPAFVSLWKAQTNCGYWHGVFGGFYLGHIRGAIFENLIHAENALDKKYNKKEVTLEEEDIDLDGFNEVLLKNKQIMCCFSPFGGTLLELSLRDPAINLLNTITRRQESYHAKITKNNARVEIPADNKSDSINTIHNIVSQKGDNLDKFLIYDKCERLGLIDHLLDKNLTLHDFNLQNGVFPLNDNLYTLAIDKKEAGVGLSYSYEGEGLAFLKRINFSSFSGFDVSYKFKQKKSLNNYYFGIEFNLSLPSPNDVFKIEGKERYKINGGGQWNAAASFVIGDYYKKIKLDFKHDKADVFVMPVYSVSSSESGFEKVYQELSVLFISKEIKNDFRFSLRVGKL